MVTVQAPAETLKPRFWKRPRIILVIVLLGFALRLWAAWQLPVDFDEPTYLQDGYRYAELIHAGDLKGLIDYGGTSEHPPLVKIVYALGILAFAPGGDWDRALLIARIISAVFGGLGVWILVALNPLAGAFLAVQTLAVKYTSQAYLEALPLCTALLSVWLLKRSTRHYDGWFFLSAIALGVTGAGKYSYFPILFVLLYGLIWEKHSRLDKLLVYLVTALLAFLVFDPYLWQDPYHRLLGSIAFHAQYSQGAHVQEVGYAWYQPFLWVSRSHGFIWHPDVFFYMGIDGLIFLLALPGLVLDWRAKKWVVIWAATSMLALLVWPTKWPQYTLVLIPALCLAASTAVRVGYEKIIEQELYWEWLHNMFPRPSRKYVIVAGILLGMLIAGVVISQALVAINRLGWSELNTTNSGLPSDHINALLALEDGRMMIGTDRGAAIWRDAAAGEVQDEWLVYTPENSPLPSLKVLSIAVDRQSRLWFGTDAGVAGFDGSSWSTYHSSDTGLASEQINSLAVDGQGRLWIGTPSGAAVLEGHSWSNFSMQSSGLIHDAIFSIAIQQQPAGEVIWFGTLRGISAYHPDTHQWQSFSQPEVDLGWGGISELYFDSAGRLWACTEGGGISLWDGAAWTHMRVSNSKLPYSIVEAVNEPEPGIYWIATSLPNAVGGVISRFDGANWQTYRQGFSGYNGAETVAIAKDQTGRYWFGTRTAGINLYTPKR